MNKKHSLIIGGTRGTGRALVKNLADSGHILSVIGRRLPRDCNIPGVLYRIADVTDQEAFSAVFEDIIQQNGKLNNLVFLQRYRGEGDDWTGEIETSLTATKNIIELSIDEFDNTNENSIVIVSSLASCLIAQEQRLSYHMAKSALNQMTRYYAVVLGPKKIRVNCVSPGTLLKQESKQFYLGNEQIYNFYKALTPLGRMVVPEEIANIIAFLCSSKSTCITGQNIVVDGGASLHLQASLANILNPV
ncbi:MAG: SDR family oxidoreductase [Desulfobacterales bacterium]|nr:SDR family oxidoreductase [Desulfobacterales bacterium]